MSTNILTAITDHPEQMAIISQRCVAPLAWRHCQILVGPHQDHCEVDAETLVQLVLATELQVTSA